MDTNTKNKIREIVKNVSELLEPHAEIFMSGEDVTNNPLDNPIYRAVYELDEIFELLELGESSPQSVASDGQ